MPIENSLSHQENSRLPYRLFGALLHYTLGAFFWLFFKGPCRGKVQGEDRLAQVESTGFIIAANHTSYLDWIILYLYFKFNHDTVVTFLAKSKVLDHPFWGPIVLRADCVRVLDGQGLELYSASHKRLLEQERIVIFPEGTRSRTGNRILAKTGVARIAARKGLPVVPTALCGFFEAWPRTRKFPRFHPMSIRFGAPLDLSHSDSRNRNEMETQTERIMLAIEDLKDECRSRPAV